MQTCQGYWFNSAAIVELSSVGLLVAFSFLLYTVKVNPHWLGTIFQVSVCLRGLLDLTLTRFRHDLVLTFPFDE